jgi:hypothetical protein
VDDLADGGPNPWSVVHPALRAVFGDKTLAAIAEARPATLSALRAIKVGPARRCHRTAVNKLRRQVQGFKIASDAVASNI